MTGLGEPEGHALENPGLLVAKIGDLRLATHNLGRSFSADDRAYAIRSLRDLADVDPFIVPVDAVQRLARDSDPSVSEAAAELLPRLTVIPDSQRRVR